MYKKLYDEDSENPESALNYARILILSKRYDEATALIEELKTRFTESTETRVLAELEEKIKKAQEEPDKQEKEAQEEPEDQGKETQDKDGKMQEQNNNVEKETADGAESAAVKEKDGTKK